MKQQNKLYLSLLLLGRPTGMLLTIGALFASLLSMLATPPAAYAQGIPGGNITNPVVSSVDVAEPAIVRIITTVPSRLKVHFNTMQSTVFPQDGSSYQLKYSGSGAFISARGDIVTADHVIHPPKDDVNAYLYQYAAQDIADYINTTFGLTPPTDANQVYYSLLTGSFRSEATYDTPDSQVYLSTAYTGPQSARTFKNVDKGTYAPIDTIKRESAFNAQDLAIVHVALSDTPSITLGDSTAIAPLDELTIIGFPGNADISDRGDPTQLLTASINKVYVSAIKQSDDGTPLLEVAGNIEHGDSGGPALDSKGHIVGIVSFQKDSNGEPNNTSFLHVSQNIQQMLNTLKLNTTPGKFQKNWQQSFKDYVSRKAGHWHKANTEFTQLATAYPDFHGVKPFLDYSQTQAQHELLAQPTKPQTGATNILPLIVGLLILLALLGAGIFLLRNRRKKQPDPVASQASQPTNTLYPDNHELYPIPAAASQPVPPAPALQHATGWNQPAESSPAWRQITPPPVTPPSIWETSITAPQPAVSLAQKPEQYQDDAEEITGKKPAVRQPSAEQRQHPEPEQELLPPLAETKTVQQTLSEEISWPPIQVISGNTPLPEGNSQAYSWPAPTTWRQAGLLPADEKQP